MKTLYIEFDDPKTGERIAGEKEVDNEIINEQIILEIAEFAQENGICGSYAAEHCFYKFKDASQNSA